jgi:hypothetical protein
MPASFFMLPPPVVIEVEEVRYDLDSSDFERLDLTSAIALIALAARWRDRSAR